MTTRFPGGNTAAAADLPATQPLSSQLEDDDGDTTDSPTATLPSQERNPRHHQIILQSQIEETPPREAAGAPAQPAPPPGGVSSDSFHRRIHEDHHHHHHNHHHHFHDIQQEEHPDLASIPEGESMGEGYIPASQQNYSGWSYSEGDEVNVPETSLPGDAQYSQIGAVQVIHIGQPPRQFRYGGNGAIDEEGEDGGNAITTAAAAEAEAEAEAARQRARLERHAEMTEKFRKEFAKKAMRPRKGVQDRYPMYQQQQQQQQQQSMIPSVAQPTPPSQAPLEDDGDALKFPASSPAAGGGAAAVERIESNRRDDSGAGAGVREGARLMPTPKQNISGSSAAQRNLTPQEKEAIEGRKKVALARRVEVEEQRRSKVARNLLFDDAAAGAPAGNNYNNNNNTPTGVALNQVNPPYTQQQHQQQQPPPLQIAPPPSAVVAANGLQNTISIPTLTPSQAQRAEQNRQRALNIRQNKLMEEAVALAHAMLASHANSNSSAGSGGANLTGWKARIEHDVRKILTEKRNTHRLTPSSATTPSHLNTPSPVGGGSGGQLTPEQRQRVERSRQRALQIQRDKIEEGVRAFLSSAMQRAEREVAMTHACAGIAQQQGQQQGQQQQDQMLQRFL